MASKIPERARLRARIRQLVHSPPIGSSGMASELQFASHWAKCNCVLISGFIEQSIREIFLEFAFARTTPHLQSCIERTWPRSRNMWSEEIRQILGHFDSEWADGFDKWLQVPNRKKEINEIAGWRNAVAHGDEFYARNIALSSVQEKFRIACDLIDYLEKLILQASKSKKFVTAQGKS